MTIFKKVLNLECAHILRSSKMNINVGKLASNSSSILKKIKENDINNKTSGIGKIKEYNLSNPINIELSQSGSENTQFVKRFKEINKSLTEYENDLSKNQFLEQKANEITTLLSNNNETEIRKLVADTKYEGKKILTQFFKVKNPADTGLTEMKNTIKEKFEDLDTMYKKIQISTQNLLSMVSYPGEKDEINTTDLKINLDNNLINIDSKRVMDLIS